MKDDKHTITNIKTSDDFAPVNMGISDDPEDQKMIANILVNSLYTDKPRAVLREYGCNAADANTEAGKPNTPIKVHVPTAGEPYLSIRDEGGGMTEEQILKVFCRLGRSTKRNSNAYTGMLGIGSKAGFAYGDSFLVTSFHAGTRIVYNCFRDKHGLFQMAKMESGATAETDGVEVKIAVKQNDIPAFASAATEVFRYFKPLPIGIKVTLPRVICQGKGWRFVNFCNEQTVAIMGNVGYNIDSDVMLADENSRHTPHEALLANYKRICSLELEFDIGELEIAANREGLQYRENTKAVIRKRLNKIMASAEEQIKKQVESAPSLWDAGVIFANMSYSLSCRLNALTWQGKAVNTSLRLSEGVKDDTVIYGFTRNRYSKHMSAAFPRDNLFLDPPTFVICDGSKYPRIRIAQFLEAKSAANPQVRHCVVYFKFKTPAIQKAYWEKNGLTGAPVVMVGSLPYTAPVGGVPRAKNTKHSQQCFTFKAHASLSHYIPNSEWWISATLDPTATGVYVPLDRFRVDCAYAFTYSQFAAQIKELKTAGILTGPLYGIKPQTVLKLGKGWVRLKDWVTTNIPQGTKQQLVDYRAATYLQKGDLIFGKLYDGFYPNSAAADLMDALRKMLTPTPALRPLIMSLVDRHAQDSAEHILQASGLPVPSYNLKSLTEAVVKRYPMFAAFQPFQIRNLPMKTVAEYVKLVEESKK